MAVIPDKARQAAQQAGTDKPQGDRADLGPGSLSGNLTKDPELRYTQQGRAVASMRLAVTDRVKDPDGDRWKDGETRFFDVAAWGQLGERAANCLAKGDRVVCDGQWESRAWEDKDGNTQEAIALVARDLGPSLLFADARVIKGKKGGS